MYIKLLEQYPVPGKEHRLHKYYYWVLVTWCNEMFFLENGYEKSVYEAKNESAGGGRVERKGW